MCVNLENTSSSMFDADGNRFFMIFYGREERGKNPNKDWIPSVSFGSHLSRFSFDHKKVRKKTFFILSSFPNVI